MVVAEANIPHAGVEEGTVASVADFVILDFCAIGLDAEADVVDRDLVLGDLDLGEVVHTDADKASGPGRNDVFGHFGVVRACCEETVLGPIEQSIVVDIGVFGANDENVEAREALHCEPRD